MFMNTVGCPLPQGFHDSQVKWGKQVTKGQKTERQTDLESIFDSV